jgi:hypothetical protein
MLSAFLRQKKVNRKEQLMKKSIISFSLALLMAGGIATRVSAARTDARVDTAQIVNESRDYHNNDWHGGRDRRLGADIDRLNRRLHEVRYDLRRYNASRSLRNDFYRVEQRVNRLTAEYRRGLRNRREISRRAEDLRSDLYRIQRAIRNHHR